MRLHDFAESTPPCYFYYRPIMLKLYLSILVGIKCINHHRFVLSVKIQPLSETLSAPPPVFHNVFFDPSLKYPLPNHVIFKLPNFSAFYDQGYSLEYQYKYLNIRYVRDLAFMYNVT